MPTMGKTGASPEPSSEACLPVLPMPACLPMAPTCPTLCVVAPTRLADALGWAARAMGRMVGLVADLMMSVSNQHM
jgi:hypothetical protein